MNSTEANLVGDVTPQLRVIARADHAISRKNISNGALRVLYRLNEAGYAAFLVGGAVRDLLLGGHPKDFDVATNATPEQIRSLFRNCRLIGRRFRLAHVVFGREIVEVATFRGSSDDGSGDRHVVDGRIVRDNVYGTIEEDAVRRDFTVNALYYDIADFSVRDYVGGMRDLEQRTMRLIGDPELRYREDPVRMLRAARLAAKLGFSIAPEAAAPAYQRGLALDALGELEDAATAYGEAVARDPQLYPALSQWVFAKRRLCDWDDLGRLSARVVQGVRDGAEGITPFAFLAEDAGPDQQLRCASRFAAGVEAEVGVRRAYLERPERSTPNRPLRVGFVSNGFGEHPTGLLTVALFEALRSRPIELHLFATGGEDGPIRRRLRAAAHHWHDVAGATPDALAQTFADAGLDRLVDLRGWGEGGSGEALALRPAPVQINWLAYPGTSGAPWIDYVIADAVVIPEAAQAAFSERVAYLPRCFQPSDTTRVVAAPPDRAACGLPETGVVLACFNNGYKLNPASFARMLAVLREVPDAVLWLLSGPGRADARLRDAARAGGVDPARLIFLPRLPHAEYLARFAHVDLFLDTAPYNAHTTASDAIWAGCPVLTLPGATFASRVAASLNTHLGMPDLIAGDEADFVRKAVAIATDPAARATLRTELARRRETSGLFDMDAYAEDFVRVLTGMTPPADAASANRPETSAS